MVENAGNGSYRLRSRTLAPPDNYSDIPEMISADPTPKQPTTRTLSPSSEVFSRVLHGVRRSDHFIDGAWVRIPPPPTSIIKGLRRGCRSPFLLGLQKVCISSGEPEPDGENPASICLSPTSYWVRLALTS